MGQRGREESTLLTVCSLNMLTTTRAKWWITSSCFRNCHFSLYFVQGLIEDYGWLQRCIAHLGP